jgi:hypothetical protein
MLHGLLAADMLKDGKADCHPKGLVNASAANLAAGLLMPAERKIEPEVFYISDLPIFIQVKGAYACTTFFFMARFPFRFFFPHGLPCGNNPGHILWLPKRNPHPNPKPPSPLP